MPGTHGPGSIIYAHRLAYILDHGGETLPVGALVCHRCDIPLCCNPSHLYLCSKLQNEADMVRRGREGLMWKNGKVPARVRAYMDSPEYSEHLEYERLVAPTFYPVSAHARSAKRPKDRAVLLVSLPGSVPFQVPRPTFLRQTPDEAWPGISRLVRALKPGQVLKLHDGQSFALLATPAKRTAKPR
jgi:hypothetical protein